MAQYQVNILIGAQRKETPTLLAIAALVGLNVNDLKVDRTQQHSGIISVHVSSMRESVIQGLQNLESVQMVKRLEK